MAINFSSASVSFGGGGFVSNFVSMGQSTQIGQMQFNSFASGFMPGRLPGLDSLMRNFFSILSQPPPLPFMRPFPFPGGIGGHHPPMYIMPPGGFPGPKPPIGTQPPIYILPPGGFPPGPKPPIGDHPPIYILPPGGFEPPPIQARYGIVINDPVRPPPISIRYGIVLA